MPPKVQDLAVLRIVIREGFSRDLADMLLNDLRTAIAHFDAQPGHPRPSNHVKRAKSIGTANACGMRVRPGLHEDMNSVTV